MKVGTVSLLFGAHQFIIHPFIVAFAWWKLYGFPWNPKLWTCFIVHDWGYWNMPNMDGTEGELHPTKGWDIICALFGYNWGWFCLLHSRKMQKRVERIAGTQPIPPSKLCIADKLATLYTPRWMYRKTELKEYLEEGECSSFKELRDKLKTTLIKYIEENKNNALGPEDYQRYSEL